MALQGALCWHPGGRRAETGARTKMNFPSATGTNRWIGPILIVFSAVAFGALPIFARLAYAAGATPTTVLLLRFFLAAIVMVFVMIVRKIPFPRGRVLLGLV